MSRIAVAFATLAFLGLALVPAASAGPIQYLLCDPPEICNIDAPPCTQPAYALCDAGEPFDFCFVYAKVLVVTVCL